MQRSAVVFRLVVASLVLAAVVQSRPVYSQDKEAETLEVREFYRVYYDSLKKCYDKMPTPKVLPSLGNDLPPLDAGPCNH